MTGCIAIGSLATAVDWFVSFSLHEPITCSYNCVIEKSFSEEEKRYTRKKVPYLCRYLDAVLVPISQGTEVTIVTEYDMKSLFANTDNSVFFFFMCFILCYHVFIVFYYIC